MCIYSISSKFGERKFLLNHLFISLKTAWISLLYLVRLELVNNKLVASVNNISKDLLFIIFGRSFNKEEKAGVPNTFNFCPFQKGAINIILTVY
jgi:hypothetical protein